MRTFIEHLAIMSIPLQTRVEMAQYIVDKYAGRNPEINSLWTEQELKVLSFAENEVAEKLCADEK